MLDNSILNTIKKMLGLAADYDAFDTDVIVLINSALMVLHQYGVAPKEGFAISGATETWDDFLPSDKLIEGAKTYIFLKVKIVFDPPQSSYVLTAYKEQAEELLYRLKEQMEVYPGRIADDPPEDDAEETEDMSDDYPRDEYDPFAD